MTRLAVNSPGSVAIVDEDGSITRHELELRSNRMARLFLQRGVEFNDYVAIALPNGIDFFVAFFAALKVGAVPMPLSYRLPAAERQAIIDLAAPALLVGVPDGEHVGCATVPAGYRPETSISDGPLPEVVSPSWKAPTSGGSTGRPKIIRAASPAVGSVAVNEAMYRFTGNDVQAVVAPLYHNSSLAMSVAGLLSGQRLVVMNKFDAAKTLEQIERHRITWLMLVPTMMHRMYRLIGAGDAHDLSSIRVLWHAASKCPEWLKEGWIRLLGPDRVLELYGGTESVALTVITGREWLEHRGSVGRPWLGDMKVLDADGRELAACEVGEIYMKGPEGFGIGYEYVGAEPRMLNGWQTLGDLGWKDEDGYLYISDRRVDMVVSGGANIYPAEVENALDQHPKVLSSVVVGLPDGDLVQRVHALVQAEAGTTAEELLDFLATRLVRYKIPRSIEFIDQPLRDDAGKVRRSQMRDEALERLKIRD
ncbi:AMP-binding protein [Nakamurella leprariae]